RRRRAQRHGALYSRAVEDAAAPPRSARARRGDPGDAPHAVRVTDDLELSIVIPCLNEETTVGDVVAKAVASLARLGMRGEVIVADNGSRARPRRTTHTH